MVYLEITMKIPASKRPAAAGVYEAYKAPFLTTVKGAKSKVPNGVRKIRPTRSSRSRLADGAIGEVFMSAICSPAWTVPRPFRGFAQW